MTTFVRLFLGSMLVLTSLFLILLVLVQRGRGGGLAGALGGMGGQSAFGTKAGDLFTRITVGVAAFWIILCLLATNLLGRQQSLLSSELGGAAPQATAPMTPTQPMTTPEPPAAPGGPAAPASAQPASGDASLSLPAAPAAESGKDAAKDAATPAAAATATPAAEGTPAAPAEAAPAK
jgi:preprotein translocase subunit SecG